MFWVFLGRILWARRLILAIVALGCTVGGVIITLLIPSQYDATARVMLNVATPDPITGARIHPKGLDPFIETQMKIVRDAQVLVPAAEAMGWLDDPDIIGAYQARPGDDQRDLPTWVAQRMVASVAVKPVEESSILEIRYRADSPALAEGVVGAIRDAYISATTRAKRQEAASEADTLARNAELEAAQLSRLQTQYADLQRKTGVFFETKGGRDVESNRLRMLSAPPPEPKGASRTAIRPNASSASAELTRMDAEIAQAATVLGPNHPRLAEMRRTRAALAFAAAQEAQGAQSTAAALVAVEQWKAAEIERQKATVLDQRPDVLRLRLLQDQIKAKEATLAQMNSRVARLRTAANTNESGLTPVGQIESDPRVAYPDPFLVVGAPAGLGFVAAVLIALIVEFVDLRVRTRWGLKLATGVPILGRVPPIREPAIAKGRRAKRAPKLRKLKGATA